MLWMIIVFLLILWLLGAFGNSFNAGIPNGGNAIHVLIVIAVVLLILRLLGFI